MFVCLAIQAEKKKKQHYSDNARILSLKLLYGASAFINKPSIKAIVASWDVAQVRAIHAWSSSTWRFDSSQRVNKDGDYERCVQNNIPYQNMFQTFNRLFSIKMWLTLP